MFLRQTFIVCVMIWAMVHARQKVSLTTCASWRDKNGTGHKGSIQEGNLRVSGTVALDKSLAQYTLKTDGKKSSHHHHQRDLPGSLSPVVCPQAIPVKLPIYLDSAFIDLQDKNNTQVPGWGPGLAKDTWDNCGKKVVFNILEDEDVVASGTGTVVGFKPLANPANGCGTIAFSMEWKKYLFKTIEWADDQML
ncbi:hypothetical protein CROQUDRAFT_669328 [Cronartium quercuum f. sp. fusiforme G11]|uniref:Uncharacterized protein n=1 Tax=Cronartium quercuum f. sp. fusiforme G11 TaxID=708437 RepID=A0A9P6TED1_9BASI|nr:hypothetical protein CROQUDRAFT_669328 [Cronartium quercuum f. sp. fusiforme G11]